MEDLSELIASLEHILAKTSQEYPDRTVARESKRLEFKSSFSKGSLAKYAKTMAAFANSDGGFIIFGVGDSPRKLIGLQDPRFDEMDSKELGNYINEHFKPEIDFAIFTHEKNEMKFGAIYVQQNINRPVVCIKKTNCSALREGGIYYRYFGETSDIKYSELNQIIEEKINKEHQIWASCIGKISKAGVRNIGILDVNSGEVEGVGGKFVIDNELLPKISFIKQGEFAERKGAPTLRLVGDVVPYESVLIHGKKTQQIAITFNDIIISFLLDKSIECPKEYIRQICFGIIGYIPIYFYCHKAQMNIDQLLHFIESVPSKERGKTLVLNRLKEGKDPKIKREGICYGVSTSKLRLEFINKVELLNLDMGKVMPYVKSIRSMEKEEIDRAYLLPLLLKWYEKYYSSHHHVSFTSEFRHTIAYLDYLLYRDSVQ